MPGPGGGPHGGGGHRGGNGFHGGGHHGGNFGGHQPHPGGGMYGPPHGGMHRNRWHRRPRYYGRGGCLGCLFVFLFPIVLLILVIGIVSF